MMDINKLRRLALDGDLAAMQAIVIHLEQVEKERDDLHTAMLCMERTPYEIIGKILTEVMDIAVSNGADSRSMPDEYVEVAAWLCGIPAQPTPSFADAYCGAMEEIAIWKKRALEAEDLNRKFIAEINGPTHMGEPPQPAQSVPDGWQLVPIDPTDEMLRAIRRQRSGARKGCGDRADWKAWLAAAPKVKL